MEDAHGGRTRFRRLTRPAALSRFGLPARRPHKNQCRQPLGGAGPSSRPVPYYYRRRHRPQLAEWERGKEKWAGVTQGDGPPPRRNRNAPSASVAGAHTLCHAPPSSRSHSQRRPCWRRGHRRATGTAGSEGQAVPVTNPGLRKNPKNASRGGSRTPAPRARSEGGVALAGGRVSAIGVRRGRIRILQRRVRVAAGVELARLPAGFVRL
jgi:hypothetical protein